MFEDIIGDKVKNFSQVIREKCETCHYGRIKHGAAVCYGLHGGECTNKNNSEDKLFIKWRPKQQL